MAAGPSNQGFLQNHSPQPRPQPRPQPEPEALPMDLVEMILTSDQRVERYGLPAKQTPSNAQREMESYIRWGSAPINLERGDEYSRPVQSATSESQARCIRGFLGYAVNYFGIPAHLVGLSVYSDPKKIISFISYLVARLCQRGQVLKHVRPSYIALLFSCEL